MEILENYIEYSTSTVEGVLKSVQDPVPVRQIQVL